MPKLELVNWRTLSSNFICGVDEVGRGCLAGPVMAGAVVLDPNVRIVGLTDSKLLTPEKRSILAVEIKKRAVAWSIGVASVEEIEKINILQASLLAMKRAVENLKVSVELVLVDGNQKIPMPWNQMTFVKGDLRVEPISAASILAKVTRDDLLSDMDGKFPGYGFSKHKGYGTKEHAEAIRKLGASAIHRKTFSGVREYLSPESFTI